jgi:class 3 adenylate cyclase/pimeloyl-ACP methyl ester carboxylesterase
MEPQIRFCTSADGTRIAYAALGQGPTLVAVPGFASNVERDWELPDVRAYFGRLAEGRSVVWFDRRGVGASQRDVDDFSLEAQVGDIAALVDHLKLERLDLLTTDDSTSVGVAYAAQHPERVSRLVLWAPYTCGEDIATPEAARSMVDLIRKNWSVARRAIADICFPSGPLELQRWLSSSLREHMSPEVAAKYYEFLTSVDIRPFLREVKAPTLVLHRRRTRSAPIRAGRAAAALIPDARFVALEGDIVSPTIDHGEIVELIREFLGEGRTGEPAAEAPAAAAVHTILITDMEGSTTLTQRLGDSKAQDVLRAHNTILRDALKNHGGSEIKHTGDGIMASFASATRALECAVAMQRAFAAHNESAEEPIRVRIGLNAGEPVAEEKDLFGTAVQLAARICAHAEPGQILASDVVQQLVAGKGFVCADQGEIGLKGFERPVRLHEVRWQD